MRAKGLLVMAHWTYKCSDDKGNKKKKIVNIRCTFEKSCSIKLLVLV